MLFRNATLLRHVVLSQQRRAPSHALAYRLTTQTRFKSSKAVPATDSPSALQNLKTPPPPSSQRPEETEERDSKFRTWALAANKIASFAIIPMTLLYAVFLADWGDHEHVFMPARRWLLRQKAAFYMLTPAEQELIKPKEMVRVVRLRDLDKQPPSPDTAPPGPPSSSTPAA